MLRALSKSGSLRVTSSSMKFVPVLPRCMPRSLACAPVRSFATKGAKEAIILDSTEPNARNAASQATAFGGAMLVHAFGPEKATSVADMYRALEQLGLAVEDTKSFVFGGFHSYTIRLRRGPAPDVVKQQLSDALGADFKVSVTSYDDSPVAHPQGTRAVQVSLQGPDGKGIVAQWLRLASRHNIVVRSLETQVEQSNVEGNTPPTDPEEISPRMLFVRSHVMFPIFARPDAFEADLKKFEESTGMQFTIVDEQGEEHESEEQDEDAYEEEEESEPEPPRRSLGGSTYRDRSSSRR